MNGFALLGGYVRDAVIAFGTVIKGSRAALALSVLVLFAFATLPQGGELSLARLESRLALGRMAGACAWLTLTIWHCCDARVRSMPVPAAGRLCLALRGIFPAALAAGFLIFMTVIELRA